MNSKRFLLPLLLLVAIALFLYSRDALSVEGYVQVQKAGFLSINHYLGQYPNLQFNLTQFGDCLVVLSFLSVFAWYAPKIWESLIIALLVSALLSSILKELFAIPRPAAMFDSNSFIIVGNKLSGWNSLPSGHSITIFTVLTVLLFALMPKKQKQKWLWSFAVVITGLMLASTRVGVGAHYPIDVMIGCIIGYISGLCGILISQKYQLRPFVNNKKYDLFFILLFLISCGILVDKIMHQPLVVFYFAFVSLTLSLVKLVHLYVKNTKG